MTAPSPQCQPSTNEYPLPWIMGPFGDIWVAADVELRDGKWRELVPEPRIVVTLGLRGGAVAKQIVEAVNSHASLKARMEQAERDVDVLESNALVQAKLLADTGRRAEELELVLRQARAFLDPASDPPGFGNGEMVRIITAALSPKPAGETGR